MLQLLETSVIQRCICSNNIHWHKHSEEDHLETKDGEHFYKCVSITFNQETPSTAGLSKLVTGNAGVETCI